MAFLYFVFDFRVVKTKLKSIAKDEHRFCIGLTLKSFHLYFFTYLVITYTLILVNFLYVVEKNQSAVLIKKIILN